MSTDTADTDTENPTGEAGIDEDVTVQGASSSRRLTMRWRSVAAASLLVVSAGVTGALYLDSYRADRAVAETSGAVIDAASQGVVALLSYAPATLDQDIDAARSHLTGEFLDYYGEFAEQFVAPAAKERDITATASVVRAAAVDVGSNTAGVLLFLNQEMTSRDTAAPAQATSSVKVGLAKVDGAWLISSFDPV